MTRTELEKLLTELISTKVPKHLLDEIDNFLALVRGVSRSEFVRLAVRHELERATQSLVSEWERKPGAPPATQDPDAEWILSRLGRDLVRSYDETIFSLQETVELSRRHGAGRVLDWFGKIETEFSEKAEADQKFQMIIGDDVFDRATHSEKREGWALLDELDDIDREPSDIAPISAEEEAHNESLRRKRMEPVSKKIASFRERVLGRPEVSHDEDFGPDEVEVLRERAHSEIPEMEEY